MLHSTDEGVGFAGVTVGHASAGVNKLFQLLFWVKDWYPAV